MKRYIRLTLLLTLSIFVLAACGDDDSYTIGVSQFVEHDSLDEAYEGFKDAIEESDLDVKIEFKSAQGDMNNVQIISEQFEADGVDLIFANATPSALGAQNASDEIPIVFTSVTDAVDAKLVESMENPGGNITGVVDLHPDAIVKTIEFIDQYFSGSKIGIIYNAGEANSVNQINAVNEAVVGTSLTVSERTVATSADVQQAAMSLADEIDIFYIFTDNTAVSALDSIVDIANEQKLPLIVAEPNSVANGGFAAYGFKYHSIGYRAGEMAVEILKDGKKPSDISAEFPPSLDWYMNKAAAEAQGIEWNADWDEDVTYIDEE